MPSDCVGPCACDCRSSNKAVNAVDDLIEKLKGENEKLLKENEKLKKRISSLSDNRNKIIDELAKKLKSLEHK